MTEPESVRTPAKSKREFPGLLCRLYVRKIVLLTKRKLVIGELYRTGLEGLLENEGVHWERFWVAVSGGGKAGERAAYGWRSVRPPPG